MNHLEKIKIIAEGMGHEIIDEALCSPDYECGNLTVDPHQIETDTTKMWPVYVDNCACDSEVFAVSKPAKVCDHYVYCLKPILDPMTNDTYMTELQTMLIKQGYILTSNSHEGFAMELWQDVDDNIDCTEQVMHVAGHTINEAVLNCAVEVYLNRIL